jgi:phosphopantetheinyl transferase
MSLHGSIHFQKFRPLPAPWVVLSEKGCAEPHITTPFTLRRIPYAAHLRRLAREEVRAVLSEELQRAAGRPVRWKESAKGPEVLERIHTGRVSVSISYAKTEAWLALGWEGPIGIDAVANGPVPDWEAVASVYLENNAQERLRESTHPALAFGREWAGFEARLKLGGMFLEEGTAPPPALLFVANFGEVTVAVAVKG